MLGESSFHPYSINTFSKKGRDISKMPVHYVNPHWVQSHLREGKFISGYWRDGDGNTAINRSTGYFARNPGIVSHVFKKGNKI